MHRAQEADEGPPAMLAVEDPSVTWDEILSSPAMMYAIDDPLENAAAYLHHTRDHGLFFKPTLDTSTLDIYSDADRVDQILNVGLRMLRTRLCRTLAHAPAEERITLDGRG